MQVGHSELVLSIGEEILASPEAEAQPDLRRDTHLSLALANCGLASERLEVNNQVRGGRRDHHTRGRADVRVAQCAQRWGGCRDGPVQPAGCAPPTPRPAFARPRLAWHHRHCLCLTPENHCGLPVQIAAGCSYLEAALKQLQAAGEPPLAPALRLEIQQGLVALRVQGALEQVLEASLCVCGRSAPGTGFGHARWLGLGCRRRKTCLVVPVLVSCMYGVCSAPSDG